MERTTAICILGMHRSGTSAITRGFNLLGAYLGEDEDLMPPLPENPEGFWERMDIYHLHESMLSAMKRDWTTSMPLPDNWHKMDQIRPFKDELVLLVKKHFGVRPLWVWKDPRTCLLLPLWKDVLMELSIGIKLLFVVRNPIDVARSLEKRNGFPLNKGLDIWLNYTSEALKGIQGIETTFLSYDHFLDNWEVELKRCATGFGLGWPADEAALRAKMASFVRPELRHSTSGLDELYAAKVSEALIGHYRLLLDLLSCNSSLPLSPSSASINA